MATAHIESELNDIANVVIMPGDPNRATYIAKKFLSDYKIVNKVRGMVAYTGYYKGRRITVFPSGMGIPSIGIYAYELFNNYNVDYIIRIGTMGAYSPNLELGDVVLAKRSYSDSSFAMVQNGNDKNYLDASSDINDEIVKFCDLNNYKITVGNIFCSDVFYEKSDYHEKVDKYSVLGCEMESFGLFETARISNKKASALFTVSNSFCYDGELSSEEREKNLNNMIEIALNASLNL